MHGAPRLCSLLHQAADGGEQRPKVTATHTNPEDDGTELMSAAAGWSLPLCAPSFHSRCGGQPQFLAGRPLPPAAALLAYEPFHS